MTKNNASTQICRSLPAMLLRHSIAFGSVQVLYKHVRGLKEMLILLMWLFFPRLIGIV